MALEDIGEGDDAQLCVTNLTNSCPNQSFKGNWFFPNGTRLPNRGPSADFYRTRSQMMICLHRRRGGVDGVYRCEIRDSMCVLQTIYIGVYTAGSGE